MKRTLAIALTLCSLAAFSQKDRILQTSIAYIEASSDASDLARLREMLSDRPILKSALFAHIPTINPIDPKRDNPITSIFGKRFHPIHRRYKVHHGINIGAPAGTPVHATASGTVATAQKSRKGYGNRVTIGHRFGFETVYAHLYTFIVKEGRKIRKGDIIGFAGSTGTFTGKHIHYEVKKDGRQLDPLGFITLED